jgi:hypothetical protein
LLPSTNVRKILGVSVVGVALLLIALWGLRSRKTGDTADGLPASASALATSPTGAAAPVAATGTTTPVASSIATTPTTVPIGANDATACQRIVELCSTSEQKVDPAECEKKFADGRKIAGSANVERSLSCVAEAKTCAAASGCVSGGVGMGAIGEFLKGLGSALSK